MSVPRHFSPAITVGRRAAAVLDALGRNAIGRNALGRNALVSLGAAQDLQPACSARNTRCVVDHNAEHRWVGMHRQENLYSVVRHVESHVA